MTDHAELITHGLDVAEKLRGNYSERHTLSGAQTLDRFIKALQAADAEIARLREHLKKLGGELTTAYSELDRLRAPLPSVETFARAMVIRNGEDPDGLIEAQPIWTLYKPEAEAVVALLQSPRE